MEAYKHIISVKEEELKRLSHQLQMQEAMLQQTLRQQQASTAKRELEVEEQVHSLMREISELQSNLVQAENEKQIAVLRVEAGQMEYKLLGKYTKEFEVGGVPVLVAIAMPIKLGTSTVLIDWNINELNASVQGKGRLSWLSEKVVLYLCCPLWLCPHNSQSKFRGRLIHIFT